MENAIEDVLVTEFSERNIIDSMASEDHEVEEGQETDWVEMLVWASATVEDKETGEHILWDNRPISTSSPTLELKQLPSTLKYAFLGRNETLPVIIASDLKPEEEKELITVLRYYREAIGWSLDDLKGISPTTCMHKIFLEEGSKPTIEGQRRLNPIMKEVVKKEVLKLLENGIIYPISDSKWVSPIHVVPKKSGLTVV